MASTVSFEDLERRNIAEMSVLEGLKTKLSSSVREIINQSSDRQQALDCLRHKLEAGKPMTTGTLTIGRKAELIKFILEAMKDCETSVETGRKKCEEEIAKAHETYDLEKSSLDEAKERTKTQERIFNEREKLLIRLPTNQAVVPVHNALLEEHTKERILIADSFKAIKDGKANLRERTADRIGKAERTYTQDHGVHKKEIERFRVIARIAKIKVEDKPRCLEATLALSLPYFTSRHPFHMDEYSSYHNVKKTRPHDASVLISLQENLLPNSTIVDLVPEIPLGADRSSFVKVMHDQINLCQQAMAEISQQRNEDLDVSEREYQHDIHFI
ncbi:hypothetical protein PTMSG1_09822 [Pyrenophora teres f. maculata]|nr:hypothetical protein PTMSG1_09822 [Pyrenophora teres f. maculata]